MNVILSGASGRMGKAVREACREDGIPIAFGVDIICGDMDGLQVYPSFDACPAPPENAVIIDFSLPSAIVGLTDYAKRYALPCVLAATGYDDEQLRLISDTAAKIPVFRSGNMSLGVCAVRAAARVLSDILEGYDIEIIEKHHNKKKDAPSGTALALYESVRRADSELIPDRAALNRPRKENEIGISSIRGGTVTGEHEIGFYGPDETVLITHRAQSRAIFAAGALKAAAFLKDQAPGLYGMDDLTAALTGRGSR